MSVSIIFNRSSIIFNRSSIFLQHVLRSPHVGNGTCCSCSCSFSALNPRQKKLFDSAMAWEQCAFAVPSKQTDSYSNVGRSKTKVLSMKNASTQTRYELWVCSVRVTCGFNVVSLELKSQIRRVQVITITIELGMTVRRLLPTKHGNIWRAAKSNMVANEKPSFRNVLHIT
ncbi:uncharacterized protein LOC109504231 isoform X2 [Harpegnathos saltator]|uniref:uncharacterized protein LOC109504231 isoform X2 n=1 Tax=Harpegnathos saltator TaxID=610380 RepID=UPI000DBEEDE0|nr:uncharacterized protein LOC109504231 isoform X2 [Harpegnathos saltator]